MAETDVAGMNMKNILLQKLSFKNTQRIELQGIRGDYLLNEMEDISLLTIPHSQIKTDYLKEYLEAELLIFASKHSSAAGKKSLLVHTTGIWGKKSGHGGFDHQLAFAPAAILTRGYHLIKELKEKRNLNSYWVGIEATHHGPSSLTVPIMFIETGGTLEEWQDIVACELIVDVIIQLIKEIKQNKINLKLPTFIGFGGGHYAPSFIKKMDKEPLLFGHIAPKFVHSELTEELILQALNKTISEEKFVFIDKKGTKSAERKFIISILEKHNIDWRYT